ncbi:M15 family metallopeptidase [Aquabacterium sp.]|uniref:M15 family metallopeptidase n=1 Tax=Aquabacterium sp. TaxID=1872578 RepID=UPI0035B401E0
MALYFAVAVSVAALWFFAAPRRWLQGAWRRLAGSGTLHRHGLIAAATLALLALPPLVAFSLRGWHTLDAFADERTRDPDTLVATLLRGEQLVPPPPLPPEVFTTAEVELARPQLASADRKWELLDADFRQRLLLAFKLMRERHGYEMALLEGYRSPERQTLLQSLGPSVTNAGAFQSYHQYGLAADCAFLRDGKLVISERDPWAMRGYEKWGDVAESLGLTWGGRWKLMDFGHVELHRAGTLGR